MKATILLTLAALAAVTAEPTWRDSYPERSEQFSVWQKTFTKTYSSAVEEAHRFGVWLENVLKVEEHNKGDHSWTMETNKFSDQTPEEFNSWANGLKYDPDAERTGEKFVTEVSMRGAQLPSQVDWRKKGIVNPVKNQEQCGSCWAFSTIASFEGQYALKNSLKSFSEQDLVDCVKGVQGCCNGCQGGLMDPAFVYMKSKQEGDDDTESAYPYTAANGQCTYSQGGALGGITGHVDIAKADEDALKQAVATIGTISVGVDASKGWQTYGGGVYKPVLPGILGCSSNPSALDHGVAVVGYNDSPTAEEGSEPYWIVRNSWGATWGNAGYMYLAMGKNYCGIANAASYPTL